jgi:predicted secreted protein with PEFG-CTERM motif
MKLIICIATIIFLSLLVSTNANAMIDFSKCTQGFCFQYATSKNLPPAQTTSAPNWMMFVILPTGSCNITGQLNPDGSCTAPDIVLSDDNMTNFKHNVAFITVRDIHTTANKPTTNYCPLAQNVWDNQDGYLSKLNRLHDYVVPKYCEPELHPIPIPEFGQLSAIILAISIISIVTVTRFKTK